MRKAQKTHLILGLFLIFSFPISLRAWSWDSADNILPTLREELDKEIAIYRQQVGNGLSLHERILILDRLIGNFKPMGLNVVDLETERTRLMLQEKQQQLRSAEAQDEASRLYEEGVAQYQKGKFNDALETFREAERRLPNDDAIQDVRRKLEGITPIVEQEISEEFQGYIVRLAIIRYLENDPKRALNALTYAAEKKVLRPEVVRVRRLIEKDHPEVQVENLSPGISLIDFKLQATLEAIYDGRYLTAIGECSDVLDLEPNNVLALTRLGSAYYAMNEKDKAKKIWTKALQFDPHNKVLRKFLYGSKRSNKVEVRR
ncbi:hypothetical protein BVX98_07235 [bacterium F11]|nr:hypothetical protein BVX98_07235 [bacterium F11]